MVRVIVLATILLLSALAGPSALTIQQFVQKPSAPLLEFDFSSSSNVVHDSFFEPEDPGSGGGGGGVI